MSGTKKGPEAEAWVLSLLLAKLKAWLNLREGYNAGRGVCGSADRYATAFRIQEDAAIRFYPPTVYDVGFAGDRRTFQGIVNVVLHTRKRWTGYCVPGLVNGSTDNGRGVRVPCFCLHGHGARRNHKGVFGQSSGREVPLVEVHFQGLDPGLVAVVGEAGRLELSVQPWNEKATVVDVVRAGHLVKDRLVYQVRHHADGVIRSGNRSCTSGPGPWSGRHVHAGVSLQLYQDLLAPILVQRF